MPEIHFTKAAIEDLPVPPKGKRGRYMDAKVRALAVRVTPTGQRSFYHYRKVDGKPVETKLGDFPDMTIEQARKSAERLNAAIADGANPAADREAARGEWTLDELLTWYEGNYSQRKRTGWRDRRQIELYFAELLPLKLSEITRAQVRQLHAKGGTKVLRVDDEGKQARAKGYAANRAAALLRAIFKRASEDEVFTGANPAEAVRHFQEEERERRLEPDEVARFFTAVDGEDNQDIRDYVLISLCTAARKGNVLAMEWGDIDFGRKRWNIPRTKNGKAQVIPLEAQEIAILMDRWDKAEGPWVFPGREGSRTGHLNNPRKGWLRILKRARIDDFRLHDLRRTMGSWMADEGTSLHTIGKVLGHKSPAATLIYARLSLDPVREAKRGALGAIEKARRSKR